MIRVFPRQTKATPTDGDCCFGPPPFWMDSEDVHISVAFTWDKPRAEWLADQWHGCGKVLLGGPAYNEPGGAFVPGRYLRPGYVITSRGCPNHCWFCSVWRRESEGVKELPITGGWNVLDDNLLACSEAHIRAVFAMLARQRQRVEFTGGLHAARLAPWHVDLLAGLPRRPVIFLAYDEDRDLEPLCVACRMLIEAGWYRQRLRSYVLCGYPRDTFADAEARMLRVRECGADPMAMVYRGKDGVEAEGWHAWARQWVRPACMHKANDGNEGRKPAPERAA
jgi:hypothetical protein